MAGPIDTSRHDTEHLCVACERNGTGYWATIEVLERHGTDEITDEMHAEIVALHQSRGRAEEACHA